MKYDYLIVGAGLFGSTFAHIMRKKGKKCLVIDKRNHVGGNVYTENKDGINVHKYGPHIFHTKDRRIWEFISQFCEINRFTLMPIINYGGVFYNLPFNMNTFYHLWGTKTPQMAMEKLERERVQCRKITNLEEQALALVGREIYDKFIKGYTEKQWGRPCNQLPAFIINRIPIRFTFDNNYFSDPYQGVPMGGYTRIIERMLEGCDLQLSTAFSAFENNQTIAKKIVFSGMIDEYFDYKYGKLEYRSLKFEEETLDTRNFQGNAVINYSDVAVPFTRIIEHKHFEFGTQDKTIITREYPIEWEHGAEPYYPINDEKNMKIYNKYACLAATKPNLIFGGRLGSYKYFNMDQVIDEAIKLANVEVSKTIQ